MIPEMTPRERIGQIDEYFGHEMRSTRNDADAHEVDIRHLQASIAEIVDILDDLWTKSPNLSP